MSKKFEYIEVGTDDNWRDGRATAACLNSYGEDGWELVCFCQDVAFMKRELVPATPPRFEEEGIRLNESNYLDWIKSLPAHIGVYVDREVVIVSINEETKGCFNEEGALSKNLQNAKSLIERFL